MHEGLPANNQEHFPKKALRNTGWELWLLDQPYLEMHYPKTGELKKTPIKPFCLLMPTRLPGALKKTFELEWKPIFSIMEEAPDLKIPAAAMNLLTPAFIQESFDKGTAHLKSRASYIWALKTSKIKSWSIGEWCKHVKYSAIIKNGTDSDKAKLPVVSRYNQAHS